jgi:hypothetical protein
MTPDRETREEFRAALEARRELGEELEPQLIDSFVERIERRIDERLGERTPARRASPPSDHRLALAIVSLCVSIPLIAIAGGTAGLAGVIAVCIAIVLVNVVFRAPR